LETPEEKRKAMIDRLYHRYGRGGARFSRWRLQAGYLRKKWLWVAVIQGSYFLKRCMDMGGAAAALVLLSPVFAATALAIKLEDRGPVFYKQTRVGKWGATFRIYKFRSMVVNADKMLDQLADRNEAGDILFKMKRDPRITRTGSVIRKLSIDEFPQFWNVLKGDMSLVGPRPAVPKEVAQYTLEQRRRLEIKPGITCFWQVGGRSELDFHQQVDLDIQYIESPSFWTDIVLLLKTVPAVLLGKGAY